MHTLTSGIRKQFFQVVTPRKVLQLLRSIGSIDLKRTSNIRLLLRELIQPLINLGKPYFNASDISS